MSKRDGRREFYAMTGQFDSQSGDQKILTRMPRALRRQASWAVGFPVPISGSSVVRYFTKGQLGNIEREETHEFEYVGPGWHDVSGMGRLKSSCGVTMFKRIHEMGVSISLS